MRVRKLRVLLVVHQALVPPESATKEELQTAEWSAEYDVLTTLRKMGHEVQVVPLGESIGVIRTASYTFKPHIVFNMMEEFDGVSKYDQNIVSYLELLHLNYTGCNPKGLMLARDKALAKKVLDYHSIPTPTFHTFEKNSPVNKPKELEFPLFVKSATEEASMGIAQASVVRTEEQLKERVAFIFDHVGSDALAEAYIPGRELYVGVLGNSRMEVLPIWELYMDSPDVEFATPSVKFSPAYRKKHGITSGKARNMKSSVEEQVLELSKKAYKVLGLNGYARMDFRLTREGSVFLIEANPNPHIGKEEDFAWSAKYSGMAYADLLLRIINLGLRWRPSEN